MKRKPRIYYSDAQKALMWDRWKEGEKSKKGPDTFKSIVSGLFFESGIPTLYGVSNRKKLNWLANHSLKSQ